MGLGDKARHILEPFVPPVWARSGVVQTVLGQLPTRVWGTGAFVRASHGELLRISSGVTLQGFYTPALKAPARGMVLMLTGWGGHAAAPYMLATGNALWRAGYEIFRLNHPDHGGTHQLSESLFHFGTVDRVHEGLGRCVSSIRTRPVFLVGFSMGGNFAVHVARRGLPGLKGVIAVSPALDLSVALESLGKSPFHGPFLNTWKKSLEAKASLFPHRYRFDGLDALDDLESVALEVLHAQGRRVSFEEYTRHYSLPPDRLMSLKAPVLVVTSLDDPILGPVDAAAYQGVPRLDICVQRHGGHVGFVRHPFSSAWYEGLVLKQLATWERPVDGDAP